MLRILEILSVLITLHMIPTNQYEDLLETNPDKILENIIGVDIYKAKADLHKLKRSFSNKSSQITNPPIYRGNETNEIVETPHNMSAEEANFRRVKLRLDSIFREQQNEFPKFDPDVDLIEETTRRFNILQNKTKATRRFSQSMSEPKITPSRRFWYIWGTSYSWPFLHAQKPRMFSLMETFIYVCRSKLPYTQAMRKKYYKSFRFRIGYIFANIKTIMEQMQWLYGMMVRTYDNFAVFITFHHFLQMYEAMIRYNIDVTDLIDYLTRLEYDRKLKYDPDYYDERPWEPGYTEP